MVGTVQFLEVVGQGASIFSWLSGGDYLQLLEAALQVPATWGFSKGLPASSEAAWGRGRGREPPARREPVSCDVIAHSLSPLPCSLGQKQLTGPTPVHGEGTARSTSTGRWGHGSHLKRPIWGCHTDRGPRLTYYFSPCWREHRALQRRPK